MQHFLQHDRIFGAHFHHRHKDYSLAFITPINSSSSIQLNGKKCCLHSPHIHERASFKISCWVSRIYNLNDLCYHKYCKLPVWSDSEKSGFTNVTGYHDCWNSCDKTQIEYCCHAVEKTFFGFGNRPGLTQSVYCVFGLVQIKVINKEQNMIKQKHNIIGCIQWKDIVSTSICTISYQLPIIWFCMIVIPWIYKNEPDFYCGKSDSLLISSTIFLLSLIIMRPSKTQVSLMLCRRLRSRAILARRARRRVRSSEMNIGSVDIKLVSSGRSLVVVPDSSVSRSFSSGAGTGFCLSFFFSLITFVLMRRLAKRAIIALWEGLSEDWAGLGVRPTLWDISISCSCTGGSSCMCSLKSCSSSWSVSSSSDSGIPYTRIDGFLLYCCSSSNSSCSSWFSCLEH